MMLVVDASVALKWLLPEVDSGKARSLLDDACVGRLSFLAPELLPVEVASALWKRAKRGELAPDEIEGHYNRFASLSPALVSVARLARPALRLALEHRHPIYDCLYLALARETHCPFVTADEKLFRAFSPNFPQLRLLRDWS